MKKRELGQYFTEGTCWLQPQIKDFIQSLSFDTIYDPFAGSGCLLKQMQALYPDKTIQGLDIDSALGWKYNDSLIEIPHIENALVVTNPPYLYKASASRKSFNLPYWNNTLYDDLYLIALEKMILSQKHIIAIIPESFINSNFMNKSLLHSLTVLEENPFNDTDVPILIACFDSVSKNFSDILIYKNNQKICTLQELEDMRLHSYNSIPLKFNDRNGWLAVKCVDGTNPNDRIRFSLKEEMDYDWGNNIKNTSRSFTLLSIPIIPDEREAFIQSCNEYLQDLREKSGDLLLTPFKGNNKEGKRRRRLDFQTCRAIIENIIKSNRYKIG